MSSLNRVFLMGNLTRDPDIRHTPKGTAVADLGMAINSSYQTQDGQVREETTFVDLVVWGRQAETCHQYLTKGAPIFVEGRLQLDQWQDKEGKKQSKLRVRAERVQFLGRPRGAGGEYQDGPGGGGSSPAAPPRRAAPARPSSSAQSSQPADSFPDEPPIDEDDIPF